MTDTEDILATIRIAAAHHRELVELATDEGSEYADALLDAGDCLDVALVLAYLEGATLFELWGASKLPVGYLAGLTSGNL